MPGALAASLIASCVLVSPRKPLWNDEIFAAILLRDHSVLHMVSIIGQGADSTPPLYHVMGWFWMRVFGSSALALRMFSTMGFVVAGFASWAALRRAYPRRAAAIGVLAFFCVSEWAVSQASEARFYGLVTALVALALLAYQRTARDTSRLALATQSLVHAGLVLCHVYGFIYSGAFLAAHLLHDALCRRFRVRVYGSIILGWLAFLPWLPSFLHQAELGKPRSQYVTPSLTDLPKAYLFDLKLLPLVLIAVGLLIGLGRNRPSLDGSAAPTGGRVDSERRVLLAGGAGLLLVPLVAWIESRIGVPIFYPRYTGPVGFAFSILLAHIIARALDAAASEAPNADAERRTGLGWAFVAACLLGLPVVWGARIARFAWPGRDLAAYPTQSLPVVVEDALRFTPLQYYRPAPDARYYFLLDREIALDPANALASVVDYNVLVRWQRFGLLPNIVEDDRFLCAVDRFLLVHDPRRIWLQRKIIASGGYEVQDLGGAGNDGTRVMIVTRRGDLPLACSASHPGI